MPSMTDHDALLAIQQLMDGVTWTEHTLNQIAAILSDAGYRVRDIDDESLPPLRWPEFDSSEGV